MSCPDPLYDYDDWNDDDAVMDYDEPECDDEWLDDFQGEEEFA